MDQIDNHQHHADTTDIQQYLSHNMSFPYSLNCKNIFDQIIFNISALDVDQYSEEENSHSNLCKSTNDGEQNENDSNFVPIVYKKRVRTKFNQDQVATNGKKRSNFIESFLVGCARNNISATSLSNC